MRHSPAVPWLAAEPDPPLHHALTLDTVTDGTLDANGATPDRGHIGCVDLSGDATTAHTLVVTVASATDGFVIDGLEVIP